VAFQTKLEIALQQLRHMLATSVPPSTVALVDAAYGNDGKFRSGNAELDLPYGPAEK
jgi:SRSO17 transposase